MKIGKYLVAALIVLGMAGMVYAAPVGLTSEADATKAEWSYNDITLSAGLIYDTVSRNIDIDSGEFEFDAILARIGVGILEKFNLYVDIGQASEMGYTYTLLGEKYTVEYDDEIMWGVGASALIYRWDNGLEVGAQASYRETDTGLDTVAIDANTYTNAQLTSLSDGGYEEIQAALEVAWKTDNFIPYVGIKYSDVDVGSTFTVGSVERKASGKDSSETIGAFVGLTILPKLAATPASEQFSINLEGRFIDEEAFSAGVSYKF